MYFTAHCFATGCKDQFNFGNQLFVCSFTTFSFQITCYILALCGPPIARWSSLGSSLPMPLFLDMPAWVFVPPRRRHLFIIISTTVLALPGNDYPSVWRASNFFLSWLEKETGYAFSIRNDGPGNMGVIYSCPLLSRSWFNVCFDADVKATGWFRLSTYITGPGRDFRALHHYVRFDAERNLAIEASSGRFACSALRQNSPGA